jgi:hypothetical protein
MIQRVLIFVLSLASSLNSWGDANLLDLLKADQNRYPISSTCKSFIQKATHQTLKSPDLQALTQKLSQTEYAHGNFYHYTPSNHFDSLLKMDILDRDKAHLEAVKDGGYSSILQFQMTWKEALGNASGVGFYVAANPFSSSGYGGKQVALKFSTNSIFFDYVKNNTAYTNIQKIMETTHPGFSSCGKSLVFSLLIDENDIDIVHFAQGDQWMVVFNEDVIEGSNIFSINSKGDIKTVIQKMVSYGKTEELVPYVKEFGATGNYAIDLTLIAYYINIYPSDAGYNALTKVASTIKNWNEPLKKAIASYILTQPGKVSDPMLDYFFNKNIFNEHYLISQSLEKASQDNVARVSKIIASDISLVKNWGSHFLKNVYKILRHDKTTDLVTLLKHAPASFDINELFKTYRTSGVDQTHILTTINMMLSDHSAYFKGVDDEEKYRIVNDYLSYSKSDAVPAFMNTLKQLQYPLNATFNFILKRPSFHSYGIGAEFVMNYLRMTKDEALLTDAFYSIFFSSFSPKVNEMLVYLKENSGIYPNRAQVFFDIALDKGLELIAPVITEDNKKIFTPVDVNKMLAKAFNSSTGDRLRQLVDVFSLKPSDVRDVLVSLQPGAPAANAAYAILKQDPKLWVEFIRLDNPQGLRRFLNQQNLVALHQKIVSENLDLFLKKPLELPPMDSNLLNYIFSKSHMDTYMATYTSVEKLHVIQKARSFNRRDLTSFLTNVVYSPELAKQTIINFTSNSVSQGEIEALLNSASFISSIHQNQFETLADKLLSFNQNMSIDDFLRNTSVPFENALYLYLKLRDVHGDWVHRELQDGHFRTEQMTLAKRSLIEGRFLASFTQLSSRVRDSLWVIVIDQVLQGDKVATLLSHYKILSPSQKLKISDYYLNQSLINKGISLFKQHNLNYLVESLKLDNPELTSNLLDYLEQEYPVKENQAIYIVNSFEASMQTSDLLKKHTQDFICQKVNKHRAFAELIESADKYEKKRLKLLRKQICL